MATPICTQSLHKPLISSIKASNLPPLRLLSTPQFKPRPAGCSAAGVGKRCRRRYRIMAVGGFLPVDPWAPTVDSQSVASQLFAVSLFPYLGFLYYITKSKTAPKLTLFGFYFLLVFVGATIPAGIYESFLALTNLFIVLGLREALRKKYNEKKDTSSTVSEVKEGTSV